MISVQNVVLHWNSGMMTGVQDGACTMTEPIRTEMGRVERYILLIVGYMMLSVIGVVVTIGVTIGLICDFVT